MYLALALIFLWLNLKKLTKNVISIFKCGRDSCT